MHTCIHTDTIPANEQKAQFYKWREFSLFISTHRLVYSIIRVQSRCNCVTVTHTFTHTHNSSISSGSTRCALTCPKMYHSLPHRSLSLLLTLLLMFSFSLTLILSFSLSMLRVNPCLFPTRRKRHKGKRFITFRICIKMTVAPYFCTKKDRKTENCKIGRASCRERV